MKKLKNVLRSLPLPIRKTSEPPTSLVGIAINANQISIAHVDRRQETPVLLDFAVVDLPFGWVVDGRLVQAEKVLAALIDLARSMALEKQVVAIAISSKQVISRRLQLPKDLQAHELEAHINNHLTQYFPGTTDKLYFDFASLGMVGNYQEWLLLAARQQDLESYLSLFMQAGLKVAIADVETYAMVRSASWCLQEAEDTLFGMLEMGAHEQCLLIWRGQELLLKQNLPLIFDPSATMQLAQQLQHELALALSAIRQPSVAAFLLSGLDIDGLTDFAELLKQQLTMNITIVNPLKHFVLSAKAETNFNLGPRGLVCCGLALHGGLYA